MIIEQPKLMFWLFFSLKLGSNLANSLRSILLLSVMWHFSHMKRDDNISLWNRAWYSYWYFRCRRNRYDCDARYHAYWDVCYGWFKYDLNSKTNKNAHYWSEGFLNSTILKNKKQIHFGHAVPSSNIHPGFFLLLFHS